MKSYHHLEFHLQNASKAVAKQLEDVYLISLPEQSHLIIYSQDVHNVNPDVDDVDLAGEGKVKLVVISGQAKMFGERDILVAENLLLGSVGAGEAAVLQHCIFQCLQSWWLLGEFSGQYYHIGTVT